MENKLTQNEMEALFLHQLLMRPRKKKPLYSLSVPLDLANHISGIRTHQLYRNEYMRDRDRVLYSKAFRRLSGKTQVYLSGVDDHKTRLTHTLEVSQIAKTISSALRLDPDLTEAIALGHDLGHTPASHLQYIKVLDVNRL
jgi:hypothetical protein